MFARSFAKLTVSRSLRPVVAAPRVALTTLPRTFATSSFRLNQPIITTTASTATTGSSQLNSTSTQTETLDLTPLKLEGDLYAVVQVHSNPFLVTVGDKMVLPFNLKTASVGDVLNFHDVTTIGSRNYTYTDSPIDPSVYSIQAVVLEKTKLPMKVREVTKRRQRKVRHAISKPHRTILRVTEIKLL